jgi:hypothetical protein
MMVDHGRPLNSGAGPQQNAAMLLTVEAKQHGLFSLVNTWADPFFTFSTLW